MSVFRTGNIIAATPYLLVTVPLLVGSAVALDKDLSGKIKILYTYTFATLFAPGVIVSFSALGLIVAKFVGFLIGIIFGLVSTPSCFTGIFYLCV